MKIAPEPLSVNQGRRPLTLGAADRSPSPPPPAPTRVNMGLFESSPPPVTPAASHWTRGRTFWLFVFLAICIFTLLGNRALNEPDEGRYAEMSREMLVSGDWWVPTLHGLAHLQKPPLIYWFTAAGFQLFGLTEWSARLPSALAALGTAWLTFVIGRRLFRVEAGMAAAVVLVTSVEFFVLARMLTPDMLMTFWIVAAMAAFVRWTATPQQNRWQWLFFSAMGFGFLTKGPVALLVPGCAAAAWQIGRLRSGQSARVFWVRGLFLALVIGLAWHLAMALAHPELFRYFLGDELIARVASTRHGRYQPPLFYVPILIVGFLPWTFLLPTSLRWLWQERQQTERLHPTWWLLAAWTVIPFVVLSLSGSKLMTYILPLYPALALALGAWWSAVGQRSDLTREAAALAGFLVILLLALAIVPRFVPALEAVTSIPLLVGVAAAALTIGASVLSPRPDSRMVAGAIAASAALLWLVLLAHANRWNDLLGVQTCVRNLARQVRSEPGSAPAVFSFVNAPGFEFYLRRLVAISEQQADAFFPYTPAQEERILRSPEDYLALRQAGHPVYGLIRAKQWGAAFPTNAWDRVAVAGKLALIRSLGESDLNSSTNTQVADGTREAGAGAKPIKP